LSSEPSAPPDNTVGTVNALEQVSRRVSRACAIALMALGVAVIAGWAFDLEVAKRVSPSFETMKANAAILLVILGAGLAATQREEKPHLRRVLAVVILAISAVTALEYVLGTDLGIDQLVFRDDAPSARPPGRMSPAAVAAFLLLGIALLVLDTRRAVASAATFAVAAISFLSFCGYLFDAPALRRFGPYGTMAIHTTIGFLIACAALFGARPDDGWTRILVSEGVAGRLLRRVLPVVILVPMLLGWLRLLGQWAGLYGTEFGVALITVGNICILTTAVLRITARLYLSELQRKHAQDKRERAERVRESLVDQLTTLNAELESRVRDRTSELSALLREREVLLQEVHHRVKNNLQVITSMINMQVRRIEAGGTRDALEECGMRVHAIALIHEKLYQSRDYARVAFSEYARSLASSVFHAAGVSRAVKLELAIDDLELAVDRAIPCGLILNELITNALKHAFQDNRSGTIRVALTRAEGDRLRLSVDDDGVGLPERFDVDTAESVGLRIVSTLAQQLAAQLEVSGRSGASFRLTFPAERSRART
jgi:two-component sensor histidine kinase